MGKCYRVNYVSLYKLVHQNVFIKYVFIITYSKKTIICANYEILLFYRNYVFTCCNLSIAPLMFAEYFFGKHKYPSERFGSELNPITALLLSMTRLAADKKVPSPPIGIIKSECST